MDLETFGLNVSHEQHTFKQVFYYENSLPFPAHSCLEFIMSGGENEGDYWPWDEFSISSTPDWSYSNLQIFFSLPISLSLSLALFSPFNTPVAFLKVPRDARGCRETPMNTGSLQSLHQASPTICLW